MRVCALSDLLRLGVVLAVIVGCGGESTNRGQSGAATKPSSSGAAATGQSSSGTVATGQTAGGTATTEPSAGGAATMADASGGAAGANECPDSTEPGLPETAVPSQVGCYVGRNGVWEAVPCLCDLWVDSPRTFATSMSLALSFTPADLGPSIDGDTKVEMEFPDVGAAWFDIWQRQAARDMSFAVMHSSTDDTTTVRLGQNSVMLAPVPLAGCESRRPHASIAGPWGTELRLDMVATLSDKSGHTVTTISGECAQPAGHPTFAGGGGGAAGSSP